MQQKTHKICNADYKNILSKKNYQHLPFPVEEKNSRIGLFSNIYDPCMTPSPETRLGSRKKGLVAHRGAGGGKKKPPDFAGVHYSGSYNCSPTGGHFPPFLGQ